jgi:tetratricopeptide (TPR) repeat protein
LKALNKDPAHTEARKGLRAVSLKEYNGKAFAATLSGLGPLFKVFVSKLKKDNKEGIKSCSEFLSLNPNHVWTLKCLLGFSEASEQKAIQVHTHLVLAEVASSDAGVVVKAADFLSDQNDVELYEKAVALMAKLCSENADDTDLAGERNRIEAKKVVSKLENAESQADVLKDKDAAQKLEEESQQIHTEDDLSRAIERAKAREAEDEKNARSKEILADLLFRKGDMLDAIAKYDEAIALDPNNNSVLARRGDAEIKHLSVQVKNMESRLSTLEGPELDDLKKRITVARKKLREGKFNEYSRRLKVNPNDLPTRFDMGVLFFSAKDFDQAIQQFQRSVQDARLSFKSNQYLGHCFKHKKLFDMAIKEFINASKRSTATSNDRLSVMYEVANCYEMSERKEEALDVFKKILEKDFGFKDVSTRVEVLSKEV